MKMRFIIKYGKRVVPVTYSDKNSLMNDFFKKYNESVKNPENTDFTIGGGTFDALHFITMRGSFIIPEFLTCDEFWDDGQECELAKFVAEQRVLTQQTQLQAKMQANMRIQSSQMLSDFVSALRQYNEAKSSAELSLAKINGETLMKKFNASWYSVALNVGQEERITRCF